MKTVKTNIFLTVMLCMIVQFSIQAQQKTGNLVEYFGKEKVNEINEGDLMHIFKNALFLKLPSFNFNSSSFPKDPVFL